MSGAGGRAAQGHNRRPELTGQLGVPSAPPTSRAQSLSSEPRLPRLYVGELDLVHLQTGEEEEEYTSGDHWLLWRVSAGLQPQWKWRLRAERAVRRQFWEAWALMLLPRSDSPPCPAPGSAAESSPAGGRQVHAGSPRGQLTREHGGEGEGGSGVRVVCGLSRRAAIRGPPARALTGWGGGVVGAHPGQHPLPHAAMTMASSAMA